MSNLKAYVHPSIAEIAPDQWDKLIGTDNPFLKHDFLLALEEHHCVGEQFGWYPVHLAIRDEDETLLAAMPMYVKTNYYGEFVFDWSWESAYRQQGLDYYPKLVVSIPYTPATGRRLLIHPEVTAPDRYRDLLVAQATQFAQEQGFSSLHWLFTDDTDTDYFRRRGATLRMGCNYHWHNNGYESFDDMLSAFTSKKRKNIRRERRMVAEQNIRLEHYRGTQIRDELLNVFTRFYTRTFDEKNGVATLNEGFFRQIRDRLGDAMVLVVAFRENQPVAAALFFQGPDRLYGRYWGCEQDFHSLHFETCYYQGQELAIESGLQCVDPGVQGEHKIPRGFLPTPTWSAHWIADERFSNIIGRYCEDEIEAMQEHCGLLWAHSPYREEAVPPTQAPPPEGQNKGSPPS